MIDQIKIKLRSPFQNVEKKLHGKEVECAGLHLVRFPNPLATGSDILGSWGTNVITVTLDLDYSINTTESNSTQLAQLITTDTIQCNLHNISECSL